MGAGKTTIGKKLAEELGLSFIDLDWYIEQRYHKTIAELFSELGEAGFRKVEQKMLQEVADFDDVVISTGGGAPCYEDNMVFMNGKGTTIYLQLTPGQLFERLKNARHTRPLLRDKTDQELLEYIAEMLEKRNKHYKQATLIFEHENLETTKDIQDTTHLLLKHLKYNKL